MAKILIVDDSQTLRDDLRKVLTGGGHIVIEAENGVAGLAQLEANRDSVALIMSDVNMPEMDGLTMCHKIKERGLSKAPIIMLTTEASVDLKAKAKELGVRAWVTKPYVAAKLLAGIEKIVAGPAPAPA